MPPFQQLQTYLETLGQLPDPLLVHLKEKMQMRDLPKGSIYFHKDAHSKKLGFLAEGIMRIYDIDESGREWNKVFLSSPSFLLGNPNLAEPATHFIETITSTSIIEWPIELITDSLDRYPELRAIQTKVLLHLFEKKSIREYDFLTLSAKDRYLKCVEEYRDIIQEIPQFHIASYLGITTTQLSRINVSIRNQQM
ncbi:MAG: Crp/Fnr family transcriptional regulator [Bacteroidota bacterium]